MTKVKEFFVSIQGEGPYVGYKQLFIRFCECNLACKYCDTEFRADSLTPEYSAQELFESVTKLELTGVHSVSLTGGEPLIETAFLKEFLPLVRTAGLGKIYLETNATMPQKFLEIAEFVDIVSADIKLTSSTGIKRLLGRHDEFFAACRSRGVETFAKIVFDSAITDEEISETAALAKKYGLEIVLSPMMLGNKMSVTSEFVAGVYDKYLRYYERVRVIPQVHKFLGVE